MSRQKQYQSKLSVPLIIVEKHVAYLYDAWKWSSQSDNGST